MADFVIVVIIAATLAAVIRKMIKDRRNGNMGCGCGCSSCSQGCMFCTSQKAEKE